MRLPSVDEHFVAAHDGTTIAYHTIGSGPPVLLCNGLGGSWMAWSHQLRYFEDRFRFLSWDYRGLYRSGPPLDRNALRIEDHAKDGMAVLDDAGEEKCTLIGWSMGVQVALEIYRQNPDRIESIILVNGVPGNPYRTVMNLGALGKIIPPVLRGIGKIPRIAEAVTEKVVGMPETVQWAKRLGIAAKTLDEDIFHALASSFSGLDMSVYMKIMEFLGEHDAYDVLETVQVPSLIVTGTRDLMTPKAVAQQMVHRIPDAEILVVRGGTHYVAVEFPELLNLRLEKFFRERAYPAE